MSFRAMDGALMSPARLRRGAAQGQAQAAGPAVPYIRRYRGRAFAALGCTDRCRTHHFGRAGRGAAHDRFRLFRQGGAADRQLFRCDDPVVAVLAVSSALRYYLVTTLGERIVADLRSDVFSHLTRLSSAFFDAARTGEMCRASRPRRPRSSRPSALRYRSPYEPGAVLRRRCDDGRHQSAAFVVRARCDPGHRASAGRLRARSPQARTRAQDTLADASGYANELIGAMRTLQAFTNEKLAQSRFRRGGRAGLIAAARGCDKSARPRSQPW